MKSSNKVRITWFASPSASRYQIWRAPTAGGTPQKLDASASPPFEDTTAVSGRSYDYFVSACNTEETICSQRSIPDAGWVMYKIYLPLLSNYHA